MNNQQVAALIAEFPRHVHPVGNGSVVGHKLVLPLGIEPSPWANLARTSI